MQASTDTSSWGFRVTAAAAGIGCVAGFLIYSQYCQAHRRQLALKPFRDALISSDDKLKQIRDEFVKHAEDGLQVGMESSLMMLPSFVTKLPTGDEQGDYFAVDLGGTNMRVVYVRLSKSRCKYDLQMSESYPVPNDLFTAPVTQLFDFIATAIHNFASTTPWHPGLQPPTIGFCFSFPVDQTALNAGNIIQWTKGFSCPGGVGADPVQLLSAALDRIGMHAHVTALLNDTVGVWAAHRYVVPQTFIGMILGTGSNACFVEKNSAIAKWQPHGVADDVETVIDIEWGMFDSDALPKCKADMELDKATPNAGAMRFEKLLSGLYMGDVARRLLIDLLESQQIPAPSSLRDMYTLPTALMAQIAEDESDELAVTRDALITVYGMPAAQCTLDMAQSIKQLFGLVRLRAAMLVANALCAVMQHTNRHKSPGLVVVAVDGSVYEKFRSFRVCMHDEFERILATMNPHPDFRVEIHLDSQGSCMGAAVLAAAHASL